MRRAIRSFCGFHRISTIELVSAPPETVLVLKPSSFGDILHALPAVARLKAAWPTSRITWLVNSEWAALLEGNPDLDGIVPFPRSEFRGFSGWSKFYRWQKEKVSRRRPDVVLDFQGLLRTAVIGRLSSPHQFYGMSDAREGAGWFYDCAAQIPAGIPHSVERYLALADFTLRRLNGSAPTLVTASPRYPLPPGAPLDSEERAKLASEFILLHPFARGEGKSLDMAQVGAFCRHLAPRQVVLVGRKPKGIDRAPSASVDLLERTTLSQLVWVMRRAAFVISVDSGPAHLAAALQRPLVAIHTWSDPRRVGPYRPDAWVWKNGQLTQMRDLATMPQSFFQAAPARLSASEIEAICALAISFSDSCA